MLALRHLVVCGDSFVRVTGCGEEVSSGILAPFSRGQENYKCSKLTGQPPQQRIILSKMLLVLRLGEKSRYVGKIWEENIPHL